MRSRFVAPLLLAAVLAAAPAIAATPEDKTKAREHYQNGLVHYDLKEYGEALSEFKDAYRTVQDPAFLYNIAQCHRRLGQNPEALDFYRNFLRHSPNAPNRGEVERRIQEIEHEIQSTHGARPAPSAPPAAAGKEVTPLPVTPPPPQRSPIATTPSPSPSKGPPPAPVPAPTPAPSVAPATVDLTATSTPAPESSGGAFYTRWWFWTAVGAAVVGGLAVGIAVSRRGEIGDCHGLPDSMCRTVGP